MKPFVFEANNNMETGPPHDIACFGERRKCILCKKRLSRHNPSNECFSHRVTEKTEIWLKPHRVITKKRIPSEVETVKRWMMDF